MKKLLALVLVMLLALTCMTTTAFAEEEPVEIELFIQIEISFEPENHPIVLALEKALGIKLNYRMTTSNGYTEQFNLMLTSQNYPDMILFEGINSTFDQCINDGILVALDEYLEECPNIMAHTDPSSFISMRSHAADGMLYAIPRNSVMRTDGWLVRTDWLEKCGIEFEDCTAMSKEEFHDMLYAFTYDDPDGNGEDDTYGIATGSVNVLFGSAFGVMGWQEAEDGEYAYMSAEYDKNSNAYVDALDYTRQLWVEGLIDPNDITNSGNAYRDRFYDGTVGVVRMFGGWLNTYEDGLHANFPGVGTAYIVGIENDDGECVGVSSLGGNVYGGVGIFKKAEDKAVKIMEILNYIHSDEGWDLMCNGVEGWTYNTVDGVKVPTEEFSKFSEYRNSLGMLRRYDDPGYFVLLNNATYERSWQYIQAACDITKTTEDMGYGPACRTATAFTDYATIMSTARNDILIGNREAEEWFDVLDGWYANGGDQYVTEMNEFIATLH